MNIYGKYGDVLPAILNEVTDYLKQINETYKAKYHDKLYEHLIARIKDPASMEEKCQRKGYAVTTKSALKECKDAIGIRVVCGFIDDIYTFVDLIKQASWSEIVNEKDYIKNAKPNGYRSYHLILKVKVPFEDIDGNNPGQYFVEIQLRTIAMDSWASLEHRMKYKHDIKNPEQITKELKRTADELASCDISMQTIRNLIEENR